MNSLHLHTRLVQALTTLGLRASTAQRENIAYLCQALAFSRDCHLASLALEMPLTSQREHLIQRLRRLLKAPHLSVPRCYAPLARHVLAHWDGREVNLVMDRTDLGSAWSILTLGVAYRKRLVPLAWDVLPFGATDDERQVALLRRIQPYVPPCPTTRVNFYADAEFRSVKVQRACQGWHWHWHVGLKSDLCFRSPDGDWQALRDIPLQPGQRRYLQAVALTREHSFGPLNLIAAWSVGQDRPRYWALDLPADAAAWRRGRKRFWIEPTFRDWKSYGFDLERSQLDDGARLNVLLLGLALTTLWLIHVGDWLLRTEQAWDLMPPDKRD